MIKDERTAWSIAKQFAKAVERLENFTGDPDLVLDEIKYEARRASEAKVKDTLMAIWRAL
jgi:hypothetical protein